MAALPVLLFFADLFPPLRLEIEDNANGEYKAGKDDCWHYNGRWRRDFKQ